MNKPLALVCAVISIPGAVILGGCFYHAWTYGDGDYEAGNFHRNTYSAQTNLVTEQIERTWSSLGESTESPPGAALDMWFIGGLITLLGPSIFALDLSLRDRHFD